MMENLAAEEQNENLIETITKLKQNCILDFETNYIFYPSPEHSKSAFEQPDS